MYVVYLQSLVPARFETRTVTGLVKGHAYSVTAVEEVKPVTDKKSALCVMSLLRSIFSKKNTVTMLRLIVQNSK